MKTRIFLLTLLWTLALTLQAQTYTQLWNDVTQAEQKDLPKSVIAKAKEIFAKAKAERNVPQMMKAYLTMMDARGSISPDSLAVDVQGLEAWAQEPDLAVQDKAVLNSILGGIFIREDFAKGNQCLYLSLKDSLKLVDYPADQLVPMVKTGETSRLYFDNNLYDLLARRAILLWERHQWQVEQEKVQTSIRDTYQSLLELYRTKGMRSAWLLTALNAYPRADEKQLREWIKEYADLDVCAEVYLRLANLLRASNVPAERLTLLQEAIDRYPHYNRINALKNEEQEIISPRLSMTTEYVYPGKPIALMVTHRNLKGFSLNLYRINLPAESPLLSEVNVENITKYGTFISKEHFGLPSTPDYRERKDTVSIVIPKAGIYFLVAEPDGYSKKGHGIRVNVTSLLLMERGLPGDYQQLVVLDKQSGHPVPHAVVGIYERDGNGFAKKISYKANAQGEVKVQGMGDRSVYCQASTLEDEAMPIHWKRFTKVRQSLVARTEDQVRMFTDRSIYRPGQKVYYSGVAYSQLMDSLRVKEKASYTILLTDAVGQEMAKQEVTTDAFGNFHGEIQLPMSGRMGFYHLETQKGSVSFRVEEYKRPTFEVMFDTVRVSYQAGDSIRVKGQARTFAGAPVQGAKVSYRVVRLENGFWRVRGRETHRTTGEAVTDAQGNFEVPVHFLPIGEGKRSWFYTYEVSATVTNIAGETQEGRLALPLGSSSLQIRVSGWADETLVKEHPKDLNILVTNLKGVPMEAPVDGKIYPLKEDGSLGTLAWQGTLKANAPAKPEALYALPSGRYQLQVSVKDEAGRECGEKVDFVLFSLNDKQLPYPAEVWSYQLPADADGTITVCFGSKEKDVCLFFDAYTENGMLESKRILFSDSLLTFRYTYQEEYGTGLRLSFAFAKQGEVYARYFELPKPKPEKNLQLKWKTFRDKLLPGSREKWTLTVLRPDGKPADASLLATMYDASLDALAPHNWRMALEFGRIIPLYYWNAYRMSNPYLGYAFPLKTLNFKDLSYSQLDIPSALSGTEWVLYENSIMRSSGSVAMKFAPALPRTSMELVQQDSAVEEVASKSADKVQLRTNFVETAFFYPQLRTDANGEVSIEFTLPESLTEWKFMGLAHTKDMDYGSLTDKVVASKEFMLQSNLPRFVRMGDKVELAASLMNLSDKEVKGVVRMELLVPETEKVVHKQKQNFRVKAGETLAITFNVDVTDKYEGLIVRMIADGDSFSDGEQRYLPVLSNRQRIMESVLLDVDGPGETTFSLESLFNHHSKTVIRPQMRVEFTGNPLWYAVQALKAMENPEGDNVLSWASAYYANSLLAHLAEVEPRIADSLKVDGLKERLLESALKLKDLQNADGSWSWYKGMNGSLYMTTSVAQLLARLQHQMGSLPSEEVKEMLRLSFGFLNKEAARVVQQMKESKEPVEPSEWALQYLYLWSLNNEQASLTGDVAYLVDKLEGMSAKLTIYGKALGAIILHRAGKPDKAREFLQSLMQYSVQTPAMGRYFDSPKAFYSWFSYRIPTQVAAIEAIKLMGDDIRTQDELKKWLLKQKQAQVWDTPIATTDAVYAFLTTGADWLQHTGEGEIKIGEDVIKIREGESLGYVSQEIPGKVTNIRKVTVCKASESIGWGAVYAEFEEELDKVQAQGNALHITRTLYKDGKPLARGEALKQGTPLTVRLTVTADRDMDFIEVKDNRAACLEPVDALSGYRWAKGIGYYQETKDASTSFYVDRMRKGTHSFEYEVYVMASGEFQQGVATVRSVYAPEFGGHAAGGSAVNVHK